MLTVNPADTHAGCDGFGKSAAQNDIVTECPHRERALPAECGITESIILNNDHTVFIRLTGYLRFDFIRNRFAQRIIDVGECHKSFYRFAAEQGGEFIAIDITVFTGIHFGQPQIEITQHLQQYKVTGGFHCHRIPGAERGAQCQ